MKGNPINIIKYLIIISIGTLIEYYDGLVVGSIATLVWTKIMFPPGNPVAALAFSLGAFGSVLFARPVGGLLFGNLGDRLGRKAMLIWTLVITGIGMAGLALMPTYAVIGILAPILILIFRLTEGIGLGGEFGGADALLLEYVAKSNKRGFYTSFLQASTPAGVLIAALGLLLIIKLMGLGGFVAVGWRILLGIGAILVVIGAIARYTVSESPLFREILLDRKITKHPLIQVVKSQWKTLIPLTLSLISLEVAFLLVYFPTGLSYMTSEGIPTVSAYIAIIIGAITGVISSIVGGYLSDVIGRKVVIIAGSLFSLAATYIYFLISPKMPILANVVLLLAIGIGYGASAAFVGEHFPTKTRYSGISFAYQFSFFITGIYDAILLPTIIVMSHGIIKASFDILLLVFSSVIISVISVVLLKETKDIDITTLDEVKQ